MSQKDRGALIALLEISRGNCPVTNLASSIGGVSKVEQLRIGEEKTLHRIETTQDAQEVLPKLQKISHNVMRVGKNGFWIEIPSCSTCSILSSSNVVILSSRNLDSKRILYRIMIQNESRLNVLEKNLESAGLMPRILETEYENHSLLTDREKEVVKVAYGHGYFEPEREISMTEVAHIMNVSTPSLSDVLRRGTKKMIKTYVDNRL